MQVHRCKGSCDHALILETCEPTKIRGIPVRVDTESGNSSEVVVADHVECQCSCQAQCNENHVFNEKLCRCECSEKCPDGEMQDPSTCQCKG